MKRFLLIIAIFSFHLYAEYMPQPLLQLDPFFTHHILVAEKSTHLLHIFKNNSGTPELVKTYQMVSGKIPGDKKIEGDLKTPEGIYAFTDFMNHAELMSKAGSEGKIYGVGAFVTNYPNSIDEKFGKSGSGIWLHSTNDETRLDKGLDSKGCVVTANNDLVEISKYIELNKTPIVIVQDLVFLQDKTWQANRDALSETVTKWLEAWRAKNIEQYMSFYHPELFKDAKGNWKTYRAYKQAVFSNPGTPKIDLTNISILQFKNYAVVNFKQSYQSSTIIDSGKKTLYLMQDEKYQWKIVTENWTKAGLEGQQEKFAFEPSLRFFKDDDVKKQGQN